MKYLPFHKSGRFWRGNLHTHSTVSDGHRSVEEVCALYRNGGYDFIAITDHFLKRYDWKLADTRPYRTDGFTTLIGAELHAPETQFGEWWHILAVGLPLDFAPNSENETGATLAKRALDAGAFVTVAHPGFYALTAQDALSLGDVHAVEVFNATSIDHNDRPDGWYLLDILASMGHRYGALATDDAHFHPDRADSMRGWVYVKSAENTPESLLEALKQGDYYASTGAQIFDVEVHGKEKIVVHCSPASRIFLTGSGWKAMDVSGNGITSATFQLEEFFQASPFFKITVKGLNGERAWTSPIWWEEAGK